MIFCDILNVQQTLSLKKKEKKKFELQTIKKIINLSILNIKNHFQVELFHFELLQRIQ